VLSHLEKRSGEERLSGRKKGQRKTRVCSEEARKEFIVNRRVGEQGQKKKEIGAWTKAFNSGKDLEKVANSLSPENLGRGRKDVFEKEEKLSRRHSVKQGGERRRGGTSRSPSAFYPPKEKISGRKPISCSGRTKGVDECGGESCRKSKGKKGVR